MYRKPIELRSTHRHRRRVRAYSRFVPGPLTEGMEVRGRLQSIAHLIADKWEVEDIRWFTNTFMSAMKRCAEAREARELEA